MKNSNLDLTLKAVAIVLLVMTGIEFIVEDRLQLPPVVVANVYFVLSIFARAHARRIAVIALGFACIVPIDPIRAYIVGEGGAISLTITVVASVWLGAVSYTVIRQEAADLLALMRRDDSADEDDP